MRDGRLLDVRSARPSANRTADAGVVLAYHRRDRGSSREQASVEQGNINMNLRATPRTPRRAAEGRDPGLLATKRVDAGPFDHRAIGGDPGGGGEVPAGEVCAALRQ